MNKQLPLFETISEIDARLWHEYAEEGLAEFSILLAKYNEFETFYSERNHG